MHNFPEIPIARIKELNRTYGGHWFATGEMEFFNTVLPAGGLRTSWGNWFITRETGPSGVPGFNVRCQNPDNGSIETLGEFMKHTTYQEAKDEMHKLVELLVEEEVAHG